MSRLKPLDLMFFALETSNRPVHMAAYQLFSLPEKYPGDYIADLVAAFRGGRVGAPFNQKLKWLDKGLARWEIVQPDLHFHVRHLAVPQPGRMEQFYSILDFLNAPLLDRSQPLWECYVIEGIEKNQFAVYIKVHHALLDGMGAMRLFEESLSTSARGRTFKTVWGGSESPGNKQKKRPAGQSRAERASGFTRLVPGVQKMARSLLDSGRQVAALKPWTMPMPFGAKASQLNKPLRSAARSYGACDLPLDSIRKVSKASAATINDIVMTAIDIGLREYFAEQGQKNAAPLRVMMPVSLRSRSGSGSGNQVSVLLVELGPPDATPAERLRSIVESTGEIKQEAGKVPTNILQFYTLLLATGAAVGEMVPGLDRAPTTNLLISNMPGPKKKLYLAGAPLHGFYGMPIVPPGAGLNVTFMSYGDSICLSVGANPDAIADSFHLSELIRKGFDELADAVLPRRGAAAGRKKPRGKTRSTPRRASKR